MPEMPELWDDLDYPSEEILEYIEKFQGTARELVDLIVELYGSYGSVTVEDIVDDFDRPAKQVRLATGGWSGCESVLSALDGSMFWILWWQLSQRGGLTIFHVAADWWEKEFFLGQPKHWAEFASNQTG